jgi:hypothetical protein
MHLKSTHPWTRAQSLYTLWGNFGGNGSINLLIDPLILRAVEVSAGDILGHGVELLTAELTVFLL